MGLLQIVADQNFNVLYAVGITYSKGSTAFLLALRERTLRCGPKCVCRVIHNLETNQDEQIVFKPTQTNGGGNDYPCSACMCSQLLRDNTHDMISISELANNIVYTFVWKEPHCKRGDKCNNSHCTHRHRHEHFSRGNSGSIGRNGSGRRVGKKGGGNGHDGSIGNDLQNSHDDPPVEYVQ
jgi:hypothetical protein